MEIGKQIQKIRKENNLSQEQFGKRFHVTRQTVSNWENEKSYPDLQTLISISEEFDISLDSCLKIHRKWWKTLTCKARRRTKRTIIILVALIILLPFFGLYNFGFGWNMHINRQRMRRGIEQRQRHVCM